MKKKPDESTRAFAASIIIKHIKAMQQEIEGIRSGEDIEPVHRMRVATRRLSSSIPIFNGYLPGKKVKDWSNEIRQIRQALGRARDRDVQIERVNRILKDLPDPRYKYGLNRLLLRLNQQREKQQKLVIAALAEVVKSGILEDIRDKLRPVVEKCDTPCPYSYELYQLAYKSIRTQKDELFSFEEKISNPQNVAELHAMRVSAKHLRYILEMFSPLYSNELAEPVQTIRKAQEILGTIHDCDVWQEFLEEFLVKERRRMEKYYGNHRFMARLLPGIRYFEEVLRAERDSQYEFFLQCWQEWKQDGVWEQLDETTEHPIVISRDIFPPVGTIHPKAKE